MAIAETMPARSLAVFRVVRALLACLIVLLAFEPPESRVEATTSVVVAAAVDHREQAPRVGRTEAARVAPAHALVAHVATCRVPAAAPREPVRAVRRLYVELRSLLC